MIVCCKLIPSALQHVGPAEAAACPPVYTAACTSSPIQTLVSDSDFRIKQDGILGIWLNISWKLNDGWQRSPDTDVECR